MGVPRNVRVPAKVPRVKEVEKHWIILQMYTHSFTGGNSATIGISRMDTPPKPLPLNT